MLRLGGSPATYTDELGPWTAPAACAPPAPMPRCEGPAGAEADPSPPTRGPHPPAPAGRPHFPPARPPPPQPQPPFQAPAPSNPPRDWASKLSICRCRSPRSFAKTNLRNARGTRRRSKPSVHPHNMKSKIEVISRTRCRTRPPPQGLTRGSLQRLSSAAPCVALEQGPRS